MNIVLYKYILKPKIGREKYYPSPLSNLRQLLASFNLYSLYYFLNPTEKEAFTPGPQSVCI